MTVDERFGPNRRGGPVFRWLGEPLAIDLANTVMIVREGEAFDLLSTPADLERWLAAEGERLGSYEVDPADLDRIRELRDAIRELLAAAAARAELPEPQVAVVNAASAASPVAPRLSAGPGGVQRVERPAPGASLAVLLGALARSAVEVLTGTPEGGLRLCRAPSCGMFFLGNRRWCCSACGNRARAARHYRRHRTAFADEADVSGP